MGATLCPAAETLTAFVAGHLSGVALEAVAAHVDRCPDCLGRVEQLDPGFDPLLKALRQLPADEPFTAEPECAHGLERLRALAGPSTHDDTPGPAAPAEGPAGAPGGAQRYRPLHLHAKGGLGEVHIAEDAELHRRVALKRLQPQQAESPDSRRRFLREAEITSKLEHPGVVPIHGLVADEHAQPCYAMRFIEGESLKDAIQRFHDGDRDPRRDPGERNLAFRQLLGQFVAVCKTMAFAHNRGVIHRDLKPANIMLGKYGETLVVDWGLAKTVERSAEARSSGEETLQPTGAVEGPGTRTGQVAGTPAYMSPEQAAGAVQQLGPASDIYSLGATLYVLLTGQAPFQGDKILDQVRAGTFARPRQLKVQVPTALEAICVKAMAYRPGERYATALALAADVEHWLADEPVAAYAESWETRVGRWGRRHRPLVAGLAAATVVAVLLGGLAWVWLERQEAERREEVARLEGRERQASETALQQGEAFLRQGRLVEADVTLRQAASRLVGGSPADLQQRLRQAQDNLQLVKRLDDIRLEEATLVDGKWNPRRGGPAYAAAFRQHGLDIQPAHEADLARRIAASPVKDQLVAALEHWLPAADNQTGSRLLALVRQADPDPYRNRFRDPQVWRERRQLAQLAKNADAGRLSPALLTAVGVTLEEMGGPGVELLERGQRRYPSDFWLNFELANALIEKTRGRWQEAVGYYRAALALRPQTPMVYNNLGTALADKGDLAGAIAAFKHALALDPKFADGHSNLGKTLYAQGDVAGAIAEFKKAIALDPKNPNAHYDLGLARKAKGDLDGAIAEYQKAIAIDPKYAPAHNNLGNALHAQGDVARAIAAFKKAIALDPKLAPAHSNLGMALHAQGDVARAIAEFRQAIALDPKFADAHFKLGKTLYAQGDVAGAIAEFKKAIALDPKNAKAHGALGQALLAKGHFPEARTGTQKALQLLAPGDPLRDFAIQQLAQCEQWLKLDSKLPAILQGDAKPAGANEQLGLAYLCQQYKKRNTAAARFFADAFAANAKLADDLQQQHRYNAACAAALAAAGKGEDAAKLDAKEKARLRQQTLDWLKADLAAWTKVAEKGQAPAKAVVRQTLEHWQKDTDLASVRDAAAVAKLPEAEQKAWRQLWVDVAALLKQARPDAPPSKP
jgi:tetratricopeptide (TPR) repeat protein/tRNA A-37 threonylcarbamoyl transferase component Bud32